MTMCHLKNQNNNVDYFHLGEKNTSRQCTTPQCLYHWWRVSVVKFGRHMWKEASSIPDLAFIKNCCSNEITGLRSQIDGAHSNRRLHEAVLSSTQTSFSWKEWEGLTKKSFPKLLGDFLSFLCRTQSSTLFPRGQRVVPQDKVSFR